MNVKKLTFEQLEKEITNNTRYIEVGSMGSVNHLGARYYRLHSILPNGNYIMELDIIALNQTKEAQITKLEIRVSNLEAEVHNLSAGK